MNRGGNSTVNDDIRWICNTRSYEQSSSAGVLFSRTSYIFPYCTKFNNQEVRIGNLFSCCSHFISCSFTIFITVFINKRIKTWLKFSSLHRISEKMFTLKVFQSNDLFGKWAIYDILLWLGFIEKMRINVLRVIMEGLDIDEHVPSFKIFTYFFPNGFPKDRNMWKIKI